MMKNAENDFILNAKQATMQSAGATPQLIKFAQANEKASKTNIQVNTSANMPN